MIWANVHDMEVKQINTKVGIQFDHDFEKKIHLLNTSPSFLLNRDQIKGHLIGSPPTPDDLRFSFPRGADRAKATGLRRRAKLALPLPPSAVPPVLHRGPSLRIVFLWWLSSGV